MKKILLLIIFFIILPAYSDETGTVWDVKSQDFWTELEQENKTLENEKNSKLDAQIELDFNSQNIEVDLLEAIESGIENSTSYKISKYQKEYSDWEFRNKLSEFLPDIAYSFTMYDLKGEFLVGGVLPRSVHETVYSSTFTMNCEIFSSKRVFELLQLKNQQKSKKHSQNYSKEELIYNISTTYYELMQKRFAIEIYRYNLIEVEEQLKRNRLLYEIGQGTKFDIVRSESEVEQVKADLENAKLSLKITQTKFANLAGYPIFANILPKDKIIHRLDLIDETESPEELYQKAMILREDIKAKEKSVNALKAKRNINIADILPSLSLTWESANVGTLSVGGRRNDTYGFMITAPIGKNLWVNSFTKYKMDDAKYKIEKIELDKMKSNIQEKIMNNYFGAKTGSEIINSKNKEIISTKEGLRQAIGRLKIGEATYLDVIEANRLKTQARLELVEALVNYNKTQLSQLFEIGEMNFLNIKNNYEKAKLIWEK